MMFTNKTVGKGDNGLGGFQEEAKWRAIFLHNVQQKIQSKIPFSGKEGQKK